MILSFFFEFLTLYCKYGSLKIEASNLRSLRIWPKNASRKLEFGVDGSQRKESRGFKKEASWSR